MPFVVDGPRAGLSSVCEPILRALPDWFGMEAALVRYVESIDVLPTFLGSVDGGVAGFLTVKRHFERAAELYVMGVRPEHHRRGIGRALVQSAEAWLMGEGVEYFQVKTLSPSRPCEHYARTRAFYTAAGFRPLEELKALWDERNPCLLLVKRLETSASRLDGRGRYTIQPSLLSPTHVLPAAKEIDR